MHFIVFLRNNLDYDKIIKVTIDKKEKKMSTWNEKTTMYDFERRFLGGTDCYDYFGERGKFFLIGKNGVTEQLWWAEDVVNDDDTWAALEGTELATYDEEVIPEADWRYSFNLARLEKSYGTTEIYFERG